MQGYFPYIVHVWWRPVLGYNTISSKMLYIVNWLPFREKKLYTWCSNKSGPLFLNNVYYQPSAIHSIHTRANIADQILIAVQKSFHTYSQICNWNMKAKRWNSINKIAHTFPLEWCLSVLLVHIKPYYKLVKYGLMDWILWGKDNGTHANMEEFDG